MTADRPRIALAGGCDRAPRGWKCKLASTHDGPCAPLPRWWNLRGVWLDSATGTSRLNIDKSALWLCGAMLVAAGVMFGFALGVLAAS